MKNLLAILLSGFASVTVLSLAAQPPPPAHLQLRVTLTLAADAGMGGNSTFNPRYFDGFIYANQIIFPGFGRYPSGSPDPSWVVNNQSIPLEHRMVAPFRGHLRSTYLLGSSMGLPPGTTTFSRYDFDGRNRVDAQTPDSQTAEGFDWVDDDTIIYTVYNPSGNRKRLYLADVSAEPFALTVNPAWNPAGFLTTSVSTRIRNVRVGDRYPDYAYYGDGNQNAQPNFYALHLPTGTETLLGNAGSLTGSGSYGVWTVLERGGYLYVQTTDNGIQVYRLRSATEIETLHATYSAENLTAATGYTGQHYGLDVTPDGQQWLLGAVGGVVFELGPPVLSLTRSDTGAVLRWPSSVQAVVVQGALELSAPDFADFVPQPFIQVVGKWRVAEFPIEHASMFYRLRKAH
jgi:hypothetical protein